MPAIGSSPGEPNNDPFRELDRGKTYEIYKM